MAKILVVDDESIVVDLLKEMLTNSGYSVVTAGNGREGLKRALDFTPDVIIADVLMPEMDGFIFYKELKLNQRTSKIPVIILTVRGKMEDTFRMLGVNGFIVKPYDTANLLSEIEKLVSMSNNVSGATVSPNAQTPAAGSIVEQSRGSLADKGRSASLVGSNNDPVILSPRKKVLLFGEDATVLQDMSKQFQEEHCLVETVYQENQIIPRVESLRPDLIFLQINSQMTLPIEEFVAQIHQAMRKLAPKTGAPAGQVIIFKVEEDLSSVGSLSGNIVDTESAVQRCYQSGASQYIGLYYPLSFKSKIKPLLV